MGIPRHIRAPAVAISAMVALALPIVPAAAGSEGTTTTRAPRATLLTSGGYDATGSTSSDIISVSTAAISPDPAKRVLVFITIGNSDSTRVTPPALTGGRVTWRLVATVTRGNNLSRLEVLYAATNVQPGRLRISFPQMKGWVAWSIDQAAGRIAQLDTSISQNAATGGRVVSLTVALPAAPTGVVVAGFTSGQTGDMHAASPAVTLGNGHSSYLTTESQFTRDQTQGASWVQLAHAMAIAVELG
jgi:hypothetical protein